ncbi:MAG: hypothetical protein EI684_00330 [Candidatus Viridilinea halotolerans]|uniref:Acyltransferase n=1 Tax=Candidatus Viridilinea halotolerans TaxID=2491704 RepID=A0A426UCE0_9CHLR|nr:MAG: hypothetical protein EI684_00330 [Candidatus Viridilinea halotolerans]
MRNIKITIYNTLDTPWKLKNELQRYLLYPIIRLLFILRGIAWQHDWRIYGLPIIQKHRRSVIQIGPGLGLRSGRQANPLGVTHPVILCTWQAGAVLRIGTNFGMTGGSIVAAERITIGDRVVVGANTRIVDTDFHPLDPEQRRKYPQAAQTAPVTIEDDVFIGMGCMILKGVTIGQGSVVGAGSVVAQDVPAGVIVAGNPARVLRTVSKRGS